MAKQTWTTTTHFDAGELRASINSLLSKQPDSVDCDGDVVSVEGNFTAQDFTDIETSIINA